MIVYDACRLIRERVPDAAQGQRKLGGEGVAWGGVNQEVLGGKP